ncbi:MAG: hypothetical protein HY744_03230 [Deltaproteobacteria bacterium]|nr:hypothetical protein [Deltaproteobacteria bacterium]
MSDAADGERTQYSQKGKDFALRFASRFATITVDGHLPVLAAPQTESTGGGKQALQHLTLEPEQEGQGPVLTFGAVNYRDDTCRLRTFGCVRQRHEARFGARPFPLHEDRYQALFDLVAQFFRQEGMHIVVETEPAPIEDDLAAGPEPHPAGRSLWWALLVLVLLAAVVVYWLARP